MLTAIFFSLLLAALIAWCIRTVLRQRKRSRERVVPGVIATYTDGTFGPTYERDGVRFALFQR